MQFKVRSMRNQYENVMQQIQNCTKCRNQYENVMQQIQNCTKCKETIEQNLITIIIIIIIIIRHEKSVLKAFSLPSEEHGHRRLPLSYCISLDNRCKFSSSVQLIL
jgi:ribosomal protein L37AE/L43A